MQYLKWDLIIALYKDTLFNAYSYQLVFLCRRIVVNAFGYPRLYELINVRLERKSTTWSVINVSNNLQFTNVKIAG